MAKKSTDPEFDDYNLKFTSIEAATDKILKDSKVFRDAVQTLLYSGSSFSNSFNTLFAPLGGEYGLAQKFPNSEVTIQNVAGYTALMEDLKETLNPELDLIDSRIIGPVKEVGDVCKRIRKTIVKREHKLTDFDRHNNSLNKLREKKEKSLSDEKNLFKVEQDFEIASNEYEHWNNLLKQELPVFLKMAARFMDPVFHSFYYMQLNVFYLIQEKLQSFADGKYDLSRTDIENVYLEQRGDAAEQLEDLTITKRQVSTAKMMATRRQNSGNFSPTSKTSLGRQNSYASSTTTSAPGLARASSTSKYSLPPPAGGAAAAAPPPYTAGEKSGLASSASGTIKKAPPPPPPMKRGASNIPPAQYCTALFDFAAQADGDLSFKVGDRIQIIERSENQDDWWTGKLNGVTGVFPGSYTQLE